MSKFNKILNYFSSEVIKKKLANFQRIIEIFVKKLFKIWSWDPGAGTNPFRIPDPGVKKAPDPGLVSATLVDSDSFFLLRKCRYHSGTRKRVREGGGGGLESGYQCTECRYQCTTAVLNYFSSEVIMKKLANFQRIIEIFVKKLFKIWSWDPGSGSRNKPIPDPGSRGQKGTGSA